MGIVIRTTVGTDNKNKMSSQYSDADEEYIFFMGLETLPSLCCKLLTDIRHGVGNASFCLLHIFRHLSENFLYTLY